MKLNISALSVEAKDGIFKGKIKLFVHDKEELEKLFSKLKKLSGIHTVERYENETIV
jgi:GTP pyrophosphokinase